MRTKGGRERRTHEERFRGRLVLVTGAGHGIGRATAHAFAMAGAEVICVDRDADAAASTARRALALGARAAWAEAVDVSDASAMERLGDRVAGSHGAVDVLVNNAGVGMSGRFLDTSLDDWRRTLDVNVWGVVHGCRVFGRQMADRGLGGHIVTVASAAAFQPSRTLPVYATSKAAVLMLTECLRAEFGEYGVGVSAVCPGFVSTSFTTSMHFAGVPEEEQRLLRERFSRAPGGGVRPPEKVARAILRAVVRDRPVVVVTPEAHVVRLLSRFAPELSRRVARLGRRQPSGRGDAATFPWRAPGTGRR
ncbi:reductase [Streptomyces caatingaensis]|uniref:Reductase n=1 Tax=Streptomyces caatingaensis TaxID=1678637 RepID=A0A0K9XM21_9ACTN|nr:reductase [Streptomyces caatingaensis]